jgi:hypothetical protein
MLYTIIKIDIFNEPKGVLIFVFTFDNRYSSITFQGIILDNKTTGVFTTSLPQVTALSKLDPIILIDSFITRNHRIKFGARKVLSLRTIQIDI